MSTTTPSDARRVVVAGGGVAALEAALALRERAPDLDVHLLSAATAFSYRPLSVLEPFAAGTSRSVSLDRLAERGVHVQQARVTAIDPVARRVVTADGDRVPYGALLVALGARPRRVFEHALTFRGPADAEPLHGLVQDVEGAWTASVAFVVPEGTTWALPLYELALQLAARGRELCLSGLRLFVVTPEARPIEVFGRAASSLMETLLEEHGIELVTGARPDVPRKGIVVTGPGGPERRVDRVVALPQLAGIGVPGLPATPAGFLPVDAAGRVRGVPGVYAAGDGIDHPVKHGGIATQQAERAVETLLTDLARPGEAAPDPLTLRTVLMTGAEAWYLRRVVDRDADGEVSRRPLWWPPNKVAGRRLAPFLDRETAGTAGTSVERRLAGRDGIRRRAVIVPGVARRLPPRPLM